MEWRVAGVRCRESLEGISRWHTSLTEADRGRNINYNFARFV